MGDIPLDECFEGWPVKLGRTLEDVATIASDDAKAIIAHALSDVPESERFHHPLPTVFWALRRQARALLTSGVQGRTFRGPKDVHSGLLEAALMPPDGRWITYPLDRAGRRSAAPHKGGGSMYVNVQTEKFPTPDDIPAPTQGGGFLIVWGGDPTPLTIGGVTQRIAALAQTHPIRDVAFWDRTTRTLWSVRAGSGVCDTANVPFPDDTVAPAAETRLALEAT